MALAVPLPASGGEPGRAAHYIDDDKFARALEQSILKLAEEGKVAKGRDLLKQMNRKACEVIPAAPSAPVLAPEEVYSGCSGGVVAITSAWEDRAYIGS